MMSPRSIYVRPHFYLFDLLWKAKTTVFPTVLTNIKYMFPLCVCFACVWIVGIVQNKMLVVKEKKNKYAPPFCHHCHYWHMVLSTFRFSCIIISIYANTSRHIAIIKLNNILLDCSRLVFFSFQLFSVRILLLIYRWFFVSMRDRFDIFALRNVSLPILTNLPKPFVVFLIQYYFPIPEHTLHSLTHSHRCRMHSTPYPLPVPEDLQTKSKSQSIFCSSFDVEQSIDSSSKTKNYTQKNAKLWQKTSWLNSSVSLCLSISLSHTARQRLKHYCGKKKHISTWCLFAFYRSYSKE